MKAKKIPQDQLSDDFTTVNRHRWVYGEWKQVAEYSERVDTCKACSCQRHTISFKLNGNHYTEVSSYVRSGVHMPAKPAPLCWGAKNPK